MVRIREEGSDWRLEHVLVTIQHLESAKMLDVSYAVAETVREAYHEICERDRRWNAPWDDVELTINPNGPLLNGGSDGDNGQTGRKLAIDFYGPRIPIGGGALSGKHMSHIDRIGAYAARDAAVRAVKSGASECLVRLCYAPNLPTPLDISFEMVGRGKRQGAAFFEHGAMIERYPSGLVSADMGQGKHFFDPKLPWNGLHSDQVSSD